MTTDDELAAFFAGRTIGYSDYGGQWTWRGSEYDSGWVEPTDEELIELARLLVTRYPSVTNPSEEP